VPSEQPAGRWGFIGLGEMGEPMVGNLLSGGLSVVVFDRDPRRVRLVCGRGATAAESVAGVAEVSETVSICVRDARQLDEVMAGGLESAARPGSTVIVHSTVGPGPCRRVERRLAERGVAVLDAPISGMRMAASAGTLTFFVGGSAEAVERVRAGLEAMGAKIALVGTVGAGQAVKIANNLVAFATVGLVDEAIQLAAAAGVEEERLLAALGAGSGRAWVVENWSFLREQWPNSQPGGAAAIEDIVSKDLGLAVDTADELAVRARFASLAAEVVPPLLGRRDS
jgi:3-hydroxyisobutyrate dehydrogenase